MPVSQNRSAGTRGREAIDTAQKFDGHILEEEVFESTFEKPHLVGNREEMASWSGQPHVKGSTETMRMALLTFSLVGLQYVHLGVADSQFEFGRG
jgi:hypothetical protein